MPRFGGLGRTSSSDDGRSPYRPQHRYTRRSRSVDNVPRATLNHRRTTAVNYSQEHQPPTPSTPLAYYNHHKVSKAFKGRDFFKCPDLEPRMKNYLIRLANETANHLIKNTLEDEPSTTLWKPMAQIKGIQILRGFEHDVKEAKDATCLRGITVVNASIEEFALLFKMDTARTLADGHSMLFNPDLLDMTTLYSLVQPSGDHPRRYVGIKWCLVQSPSKLFRNRDFCYLECQKEFKDSKGRRGWVRSMHSIRIPSCPVLEKTHGFVRASLYRCGLTAVESGKPGVLNVTYTIEMDLKGKFPEVFQPSFLAQRIASLASVDKFLQQQRLSSSPLLGDLDMANLQNQDPYMQVTACPYCYRTFSKFTKRCVCRKCGESVCKHCSDNWLLDVPVIGKTKVRICTICSADAKFAHVPGIAQRRRTTPTAREENATGDKKPTHFGDTAVLGHRPTSSPAADEKPRKQEKELRRQRSIFKMHVGPYKDTKYQTSPSMDTFSEEEKKEEEEPQQYTIDDDDIVPPLVAPCSANYLWENQKTRFPSPSPSVQKQLQRRHALERESMRSNVSKRRPSPVLLKYQQGQKIHQESASSKQPSQSRTGKDRTRQQTYPFVDPDFHPDREIRLSTKLRNRGQSDNTQPKGFTSNLDTLSRGRNIALDFAQQFMQQEQRVDVQAVNRQPTNSSTNSNGYQFMSDSKYSQSPDKSGSAFEYVEADNGEWVARCTLDMNKMDAMNEKKLDSASTVPSSSENNQSINPSGQSEKQPGFCAHCGAKEFVRHGIVEQTCVCKLSMDSRQQSPEKHHESPSILYLEGKLVTSNTVVGDNGNDMEGHTVRVSIDTEKLMPLLVDRLSQQRM